MPELSAFREDKLVSRLGFLKKDQIEEKKRENTKNVFIFIQLLPAIHQRQVPTFQSSDYFSKFKAHA